jgi:DNA-binding NarL/FixJ family response regulator
MQRTSVLQQAVSILLIDDHEMVRRGIRMALETIESNYQFMVFEAESAEDAFRMIEKKEFDLIIIDYRLPGINGDEAVKMIKSQHPDIKILGISIYDDPGFVQSMIRSGSDGYILKNVGGDQLLHAVRSVLRGEKYFSSEVAVRLIEVENENARIRDLLDKYGLTQREIEILRLIAREKTNEDISKQLFISKRTVDTHRQNLLHKLQVKNTAGLVRSAIQLKLL